MRGRALLTKRGKHIAPGMECLKQAVELDPGFAAAWGGLAEAFAVQGYMGMAPPGECMPRALTAARRAVSLDATSGEAHCALAAGLMLWEHDYDAARRSFLKGLELNPNYTQGRSWYGLFLLQWIYGEIAPGLAEVRLAYERDPLSAYTASIMAFALAQAGETAEGLTFARLAVERDPDAFVYHWIHTLIAHLHGAWDECFAAADRAAEVSNRHHFVLAFRALACADSGRLVEARALYDELRTKRTHGYVPYFSLASAASATGDMDGAIELAQQACDEREPGLVIMSGHFPAQHSLRNDPRFADVLRRVGLPNLSKRP
jgi:tetratricopeptide (TPR) repeat protein